MVRTRIAPSPTGEDIHIGNLYTALINFAVAKRNNGKFIIRIEDTDRTRFVEGSEARILSSLNKFGIIHDEGPDVGGPFAPYRQSDRKESYAKYTQTLIEKGAAYYCFCSKERLDEVRKEQQEKKQLPRYDKHCLNSVTNSQERIKNGEQYVVRLNVVADKKIKFTDVIRGEIEFNSNQVDDQVLLKSDGFPTYHLGVVVDDHAMEISHVIRAEEWITSTPKHVLLYEAFGWELPIFAHVPILRNPDKSKLSKRKNPVWASWYLDEGFLPEAVVNYLALMGWSHPEEKEVFPLSEFIELFDLKDVKPVGPVFDLEKLKWMNGEYIRSLPIENLKSRVIAQNPQIKEIDDKFLDQLLPLAQTRMVTLNDFYPLVKFLVESIEIALTEEEKKIAQELQEQFSALENWDSDAILSILKNISTAHNIKMSVLYKILTGNERGLPLSDILYLAGKGWTMSRLSNFAGSF